MAEKGRKYKVFLSAAEPSGDAHCAALIRAMKRSDYDIEFIGVGGPQMAAAGCELLESTVNRAVMIYNAFSEVLYFYKLIKRITYYLIINEVDLVILCDSPAFNFHVAKAAKKRNIKTLFYVAPQLWAWAAWRIKKLQKWCDKLCCILPFEEKWFSERGVDVGYVGNPLLESLNVSSSRPKNKYKGFERKFLKLALMPGSRPAEIKTLWVPMQKIAINLRRRFPETTITVATVDARMKEILRSLQLLGFRCNYSIGSVFETASRADFAVTASGSATLQVAAAGCPMVVMYQSSRLLWHLMGRWLVKTKYLSLVNILANKEVVPEFMPYFSSIEPIIQKIESILQDKGRLVEVSAELAGLAKSLGKKKASEEVAQTAYAMLE
ncbi:MAG: lipid-A-disaccharide synthase [Planctomycetota bacterium]|jgi:lipid-A-disaccharide synthase